MLIPLIKATVICYNAFSLFGSEITTSIYGNSIERRHILGPVFYIIVVLIIILFIISPVGYRKEKKSGIIVTEKPGEIEQRMTSSADELMKYKKLLDDGAITQDEYNAKKKELLDCSINCISLKG